MTVWRPSATPCVPGDFGRPGFLYVATVFGRVAFLAHGALGEMRPGRAG
jgi:hypothetical protein